MNLKPAFKQAYTLVEILVVVGIVLVLSSIVVAVINPDLQRDRASDSVITKAVGDIAGAMEVYKSVHGRYPQTADDIDKLKSYIGPGFTVYQADTTIIGFNNESIDTGSATNSVYWDTSSLCLQAESTQDNGGYIYWNPSTSEGVTSSPNECSSAIANLTDTGPDDSEESTDTVPVGSEFVPPAGSGDDEEDPLESITANLLAWYQFDGGSGTTFEDSENDNDGTFQGNVDWETGKFYTTAAEFDSSDEKGEVNGLLGAPHSLTMTAWVNTSSISPNGSEVISLGNYIGLRLTSGSVMGHYYADTNDAFFDRWTTETSSGIADGTWHHIAYVMDDVNDEQVVYVDGSRAATTDHTDSIKYSGLGDSLVIGAHGYGSLSYAFNGRVDEVRIYEGALTDSDITDIYNYSLSPLPDPFAYQDMNEGSGTNVNDDAGNGHNASFSSGMSSSNWGSGYYSNGLSFDGNDDYLNGQSTMPIPNKMTISAWIKTGSDGSIFGNFTPNQEYNSRTLLRVYNGKLQGGTYIVYERVGCRVWSGWGWGCAEYEYEVRLVNPWGNNTKVTGNTNVNDNNWHHVAFVLDGNNLKLYLDGELDAEANIGFNSSYNTDQWSIGSTGTDYDRYPFNGLIDETQFYNEVLTQSEIKRIMQRDSLN